VEGNLQGGRIVASYLQDETKLRVVVNVPAGFPLKNVDVDCTEAGGGSGQAKKWGLMMNCLLKNGDGGVIDALLLWKKNIDATFDGVEPCPICFCVRSTLTHASLKRANSLLRSPLPSFAHRSSSPRPAACPVSAAPPATTPPSTRRAS
jgi:hypothetical protein